LAFYSKYALFAGLLAALGLTLILARPARADAPAPALIIIEGNYTHLQTIRRQVEQIGGQVGHIFPPNAFIARLTPEQAAHIQSLPQVASLTFDPVVSAAGGQLDLPSIIWNNAFHGSMAALQVQPSEPFSDELLLAPDLPLQRERLEPQIAADLAYASYYDTSKYMVGDIVVALVLPESNGVKDANKYNWTAGEVATVQSTTVAGLDRWIRAEPNAKITFVYVWANVPPPGGVQYTVESDYEAEGYTNFNVNVINSFMARLGYTSSNNALTNIRDYINDLRQAYQTEWAYLVQVRKGNGRAGAYINGPTATIYSFDLRDGFVIAHESGHIFGAADEYCPGACTNPLTRYGYLEGVNANSQGPAGSGGSGYFNGKGEGVNNIMINDYPNIAPYTRGQIGWRDADGDGILDVRDTFPNTSLMTPSQGATLVIEGQVTVAPWPGYENDVSINTISGVEVRLNQLTWLPAGPVDGNFDGQIEAFRLILPALPKGNYSIEARGQNDVGNVERSYAQITLGVRNSPVTNAAPFAAFQVNPAYANMAATFRVDAGDSADLEGHGLLVRWDWENDGNWDTGWSTSRQASHQYTSPGIKVVAMQLQDNRGAVVKTTRTVNVVSSNTSPIPFFIVQDGDSRFATATPKFTFDATGSRDGETPPAALEFRWDFEGDGSWDTGWAKTANPVVEHSFSLDSQGKGDGQLRSNHWAVTLQVRDGQGAQATTVRHIWANPYNAPPVSSGLFSADIIEAGEPLPLNFSLTGDPDFNMAWDGLLEHRFDWDSDGNWDTDFYPASQWLAFKLNPPGRYLVTMQTRDRYGATAQVSQPLLIPAPPTLLSDGWLDATAFVGQHIQTLFTITNAGHLTLTFSLSENLTENSATGDGYIISGQADIPWLTFSSMAGSVGGERAVSLIASFDSEGLAPASYTGQLLIASNDPNKAQTKIPIAFTVQAGAPPISNPLFLPVIVRQTTTRSVPLGQETDQSR
jgi:hypothetical protein